MLDIKKLSQREERLLLQISLNKMPQKTEVSQEIKMAL